VPTNVSSARRHPFRLSEAHIEPRCGDGNFIDSAEFFHDFVGIWNHYGLHVPSIAKRVSGLQRALFAGGGKGR